MLLFFCDCHQKHSHVIAFTTKLPRKKALESNLSCPFMPKRTQNTYHQRNTQSGWNYPMVAKRRHTYAHRLKAIDGIIIIVILVPKTTFFLFMLLHLVLLLLKLRPPLLFVVLLVIFLFLRLRLHIKPVQASRKSRAVIP